MEQLIIFAVLLSLGYVFGRLAEHRHYRSIQRREQEWIKLPATSLKRVPDGGRVVAAARLVNGSTVVSVDYFKRILAVLRSFFGGSVQSYETLVDRARREAVLRMKESCPDADMIINIRLETSSISKGRKNQVGAVEVLAFGTAVYFKA